MKTSLFILLIVAALLCCASGAYTAEVLILGDAKLKPVSDVIDGINKALSYNTTVKSPADVTDDLEGAVYREGAKAVVALGQDAVNLSLSLPESIPVIYGLVINPLETQRKNITGVYMATPVSEYTSFINKHFPGIKKLGIICDPVTRTRRCLNDKSSNVIAYNASNPYEFVAAISGMRNNVDALLLLPEKNLISQTAIEKTFLFSFRDKIPVIGISEKYVKMGSIFSLGFDEEAMGLQIGRLTLKTLSLESAEGLAPQSPDRFNLYINKKTAEAMNITIPGEVLKTAVRIYQ